MPTRHKSILFRTNIIRNVLRRLQSILFSPYVSLARANVFTGCFVNRSQMNAKSADGFATDLISDPVKRMIIGFPDEVVFINNELMSKYFTADCAYNWSEIEKLLPCTQNDSELTFEFGSMCVRKLRSIWIHSELYFAKLMNSNYACFSRLMKWTQSEEILWDFLSAEKVCSSAIENGLLITSILENALGNVFFTQTKQPPPHLLKDLLKSKELEIVFEKYPIFFLKILLGSPNCVNLRNILWHGFPSVEDVPSYYPAVLVLCIASLSLSLEKKNIKVSPRTKLPCPVNFFEQLKFTYDENKLVTELNSMECLSSATCIPATHLLLWKRLYALYRSQNYAKFALLILPQIELLFRIIYGSWNKVDISAKFDEYYIVMDTLFQASIDNFRTNQMYNALDESVLKLTYDIFISQLGPRIRDKVGHGEMDLSTIDDNCCRALFCLALCLLSKDLTINNYESTCHPNSILWTTILSTETRILKIQSLDVPEQLKPYMTSYSISRYFVFDCDKLKLQGQVKIFNRPAKESEIIIYLTSAVNFVDTACCNTIESLEEQFSMFAMKTLRSRRRQTLYNILQHLSDTTKSFEAILNAAKRIFIRLQCDGSELLAEHGFRILKFSKNISTLAINISKYCSKQSNDWERRHHLCLKLYELLNECKDLLE